MSARIVQFPVRPPNSQESALAVLVRAWVRKEGVDPQDAARGVLKLAEGFSKRFGRGRPLEVNQANVMRLVAIVESGNSND